jgi:flavin prenyltransferase
MGVAPFRLVIGMTGGPGTAFGVRLLEVLREADVQTHLVMAPGAERSILEETGREPAGVRRLADRSYDNRNMAARISSGSFLTGGMIVAPCSMVALAAIATGMASDLVQRAADVTIKEGRTLVLLLGEKPSAPSHVESLRRLSTIRSVILPPVGAFSPTGPDPEMVETTVRAVLDRFAIPPIGRGAEPTPMERSVELDSGFELHRS